jgi:hypothetical protein
MFKVWDSKTLKQGFAAKTEYIKSIWIIEIRKFRKTIKRGEARRWGEFAKFNGGSMQGPFRLVWHVPSIIHILKLLSRFGLRYIFV